MSNCSRTPSAASPALYRQGLLSEIALKKVFPSRPDSRRGQQRCSGQFFTAKNAKSAKVRCPKQILSRSFLASLAVPFYNSLSPLQVSDRITGLLVCARLWKTEPADTKRITPQSLRRATGSTRTARRHELCEGTPSSCVATQVTAFRPRTSPVTGIRRYRTSSSWEANPTPFLLGRQPSILG